MFSQGAKVVLQGASVGIKGKLFQYDAFHPFLLGGFGFYGPRVTSGSVASKSKVVFGTHFGAGGELRLNRKFTLGLLAHYHNPFDVRQEFGPEAEGSYLKLLITTFYRF